MQQNNYTTPSEERLIARWKNKQQQPILDNLSCLICKKIFPLSMYKQYTTDDIFHAGQLIRYQCPNCDVIFGDLRFLSMTSKEIGEDYEDVYSYYKEGDSGPIYYEVIKQIPSFQDTNKTLLDFAAGKWSSLIQLLKNNGHTITGYDKYVTDCNFILSDLGKQTFDIVYSTNYIEHLVNPVEQFREMLKFVNPDGELIMISPCFNYVVTETHYHCVYFVNDKSLQYICNELDLYISASYSFDFPWESHQLTAKVFKRKNGFINTLQSCNQPNEVISYF